MTPTRPHERVTGSNWLIELAAECLNLPADAIDPAVPLVRYGLDSLGSVRLTSVIAAELRRDVPEWLLLEHPDIRSLERYVDSVLTGRRTEPPPMAAVSGEALPAAGDTVGPRTEARAGPLQRMLRDAVLPADIAPACACPAEDLEDAILLTGASGFLGGYVLRALLRDTSAQIYCLIRCRGPRDGARRIRENLGKHDLWQRDFSARLHVVPGDLESENLGMDRPQRERLCRRIDELYHCAAAVNWALPYAGLRQVNVLGTRELLRISCRFKPKPFHFVSSTAACFSTSGPRLIDEHTEMTPYLDGLHLGYAQSKCVAEKLVRSAGQRGLPVTIHRPTLLSGDAFGASNPGDLLSTMIRGCVRMGVAPDLNWSLDACPVDFAADAIVGLAHLRGDSPRFFHLTNSARRHWREVVLWLNLYGYPVKLIPHIGWLERLRAEAVTPDHPFYGLRPFFLSRPAGAAELTMAELYEDHRRSRLVSRRTAACLRRLCITCPASDIAALDRQVGSLVKQGALPPVSRPKQLARTRPPAESCLRKLLTAYLGDQRQRILRLEALPEQPANSITTELVRWRYGTQSGLARYRALLERDPGRRTQSLELFVKIKPADWQVREVLESVAAACGESVGDAVRRFSHHLGLSRCHQREAAIYHQQDARFRKHAPAFIGSTEDERRQRWLLALEWLSDLEQLDPDDCGRDWLPRHVQSALLGLARLDAIWYRREAELGRQPWLARPRTSATMAESRELWDALARYSERFFTVWLERSILGLQQRWIADVERWWRPLEQLPRTLIHNDFNPRNLAFRRDRDGPRLCAYDWELAALGVPQHDVAELLCFVLPPGTAPACVLRWVDTARRQLELASGCLIDDGDWRLGLRLALRDLMINRLPLYCLIHTFRRQPFLPRVVRAWQTIHDALTRAE